MKKSWEETLFGVDGNITIVFSDCPDAPENKRQFVFIGPNANTYIKVGSPLMMDGICKAWQEIKKEAGIA